jgi:hypothetical protein
MPYYERDEEGETKEIPIRYVRSSDYKAYYAHGAQGGILSSYHYRIDFTRDDMPPTTGTMTTGGVPDREENPIVNREIGVSVYVSIPFAKQLRDWLDTNIKKFEEEHGEIKTLGMRPEDVE